MTNERVCATDTGLPAFRDRLNELQKLAVEVHQICHAVYAMDGDFDERATLRGRMITFAADLAQQINDGLDDMHFPEGLK